MKKFLPSVSESSNPESSEEKFVWPTKTKAIEDPLEFKANKCSQRARKVNNHSQEWHYEVWIDQHYHYREQLGDEKGKREGIDPKTVEHLIRRSVKHMLHYSSCIKGFTFLNFNLPPGDRPQRIVLQENQNDTLLNVVIETHHIDINIWEITVKTAMCKDDYELSDNQYAIQIDGDSSLLFKRDLKVTKEISHI